MANILLIDDNDTALIEALSEKLELLDHRVQALDGAEDGLRLLLTTDHGIDVVLVDNSMPRMNGLEFLEALIAREIRVPVIFMTGSHNDTTTIQAMNKGAFDYVIKPTSCDEIMNKFGPVIEDALEFIRRPKIVNLDEKDDDDTSVIVGKSRSMIEVLKSIGRLARINETVLITGETGTGKDLVARAIHTNSSRVSGPFVVINCGENLLDDKLFGREADAAGADKLCKGRFEHAHGGTLLLDQVSDMPLPLQVKLIQVLDNREIVRNGGNEPIEVDVRVLAATHRDLNALMCEGKFHKDLFHRLDVLRIHLPPLRERKDDVDLLARRFLRSSALTPHPEALDLLRNHPWPGNIRQLQKVLYRAAGACRGQQILPGDLDFCGMETPPRPETSVVDEKGALIALRHAIAWAWDSGRDELFSLLRVHLERELLRHAVAQPLIGLDQLALRLGMAKNALLDRLKHYGLPYEEAKAVTEPIDDLCTKGIAVLLAAHRKGEKISVIKLAEQMGVTRPQLYENAEFAPVREMASKLFKLFTVKASRGSYQGPRGSKNKDGRLEAQDTTEDDD